MSPTQSTCPTCGAAIELPEDPESGPIRCAYCGTSHARAAFVGAHAAAAERLHASLGKKLDDHASAQRKLVAGLVVGLGGILLVVGLLVRSNDAATPESTASAAAPAAAPPPPAEAPPAPPPPTPPAEPAAPPPPAPRVVFGGTGTGEGRFEDAANLAVDREGSVYVADRTNRIQVFDPQGRLLRTIVATTRRQPINDLTTDVTYVQGLAVDGAGKLYVALGYDLIRFDAATGREEKRFLGRFGSTCYRDVSTDQTGRLYVVSACTDTDRYALYRLRPNGRVDLRIAQPNVYEEAATGRIAVDGAGRWYVPFGYSSEVRVLEPGGALHTRIGRAGNGPGELTEYAVSNVALDPEGRVYVRSSDELEVFAPDGRWLGRFDTSAVGRPYDVAIATDGTVWVLTSDDRVAAFPPFEPAAEAR